MAYFGGLRQFYGTTKLSIRLGKNPDFFLPVTSRKLFICGSIEFFKNVKIIREWNEHLKKIWSAFCQFFHVFFVSLCNCDRSFLHNAHSIFFLGMHLILGGRERKKMFYAWKQKKTNSASAKIEEKWQEEKNLEKTLKQRFSVVFHLINNTLKITRGATDWCKFTKKCARRGFRESHQ